jgi:hypothetical protein
MYDEGKLWKRKIFIAVVLDALNEAEAKRMADEKTKNRKISPRLKLPLKRKREWET